MTDEKPIISKEETDQVVQLFEQYKEKKGAIPSEIKGILAKINDKAWLIKNDKERTYEDKLAAFRIIEKVHTLLERKFDPSWEPKDKSKKGQAQAWIATPEQRRKNCNDLKTFLHDAGIWDKLTPAEQANVYSSVWGSVKQ